MVPRICVRGGLVGALPLAEAADVLLVRLVRLRLLALAEPADVFLGRVVVLLLALAEVPDRLLGGRRVLLLLALAEVSPLFLVAHGSAPSHSGVPMVPRRPPFCPGKNSRPLCRTGRRPFV